MNSVVGSSLMTVFKDPDVIFAAGVRTFDNPGITNHVTVLIETP